MMDSRTPPGRFTKCLAHMPRETAQSYLGRLTAFFGARSPKDFCKDYMLDLRGIQHGDPNALRRLVALTGADLEELIRWTPRRIDKSFMELNGEVLHTRLNPRHVVSICPSCAQEDIEDNIGMPLDQAVYGRAEWMIGLVDVCLKHRVKLVSHRASLRTAEKLDVGYETGHLLEELPFIQPEAAEPNVFELYVLGRVGVAEPMASPLLDPLPLPTVTQLCHAAGLDLLRRRGTEGTPSDGERRAAGFEMLGYGKERLERVFIEMREGLRLSEMTTRVLPRLVEYLLDSAEVGRDVANFVDAFVDVCFRNMPYGEGQILLGRPCPKRWLHDFPSARSTYGIGRHHLHVFVLGTPDLAAYVGERRQDSLIRAEVADRLFIGRTPFLSSQAVIKDKMGWDINPRNGLACLMGAGIIKPEAGASTSEMPPVFSEPELEKAMADFFSRFEPVDPFAPDMESTLGIAMTLGMTNNVLWQLLASGKVRKLGRTEEDGLLRSMRLNVKEVLAAATGVEDPMIKSEVCVALDIKVDSLDNLVAHGLLDATNVPEELSAKISMVFSRDVVTAFSREFISLGALRALLPGAPSYAAVQEMGFVPAICLEPLAKSRTWARFYRRSEVETLLEKMALKAA